MLAYSPGGQRIVTAMGRSREAKVWEAQTGKELFRLVGHDDVVTSVDYSLDGKWIVTASLDKTAKVWDAETGKELVTLSGHDLYVTSAIYSSDGKRIVTSSADKTARVYTTDMDELLQIAESRITRQLTYIEREKYGSLLE